jgi:ribosomal-protein-alanine N-acetyltransferase
MRPEDLERMLQIEVRSFTTPWTAEMFLGQRERANQGEVFVARAGESGTGEVVGYVCLWLVDTIVHIDDIAVDPAHRRRGIAAQLVRIATAWARERGARELTLEVRSSNQAAHELYRRFGFQVAGTRRSYYEQPREDAIIMTLTPLDA